MSFRPVWPASTVGSRPAWTTDSVRLFSIIKSRRRKFRLSQISAASGPHPPQGSVHPLLPEPARLAWREPPRETRGAPTPRPCGLDGRGRMDRTTCAPGAGGTGRPGLAPRGGRGRHLGTSHLPVAGGGEQTERRRPAPNGHRPLARGRPWPTAALGPSGWRDGVSGSPAPTRHVHPLSSAPLPLCPFRLEAAPRAVAIGSRAALLGSDSSPPDSGQACYEAARPWERRGSTSILAPFPTGCPGACAVLVAGGWAWSQSRALGT